MFNRYIIYLKRNAKFYFETWPWNDLFSFVRVRLFHPADDKQNFFALVLTKFTAVHSSVAVAAIVFTWSSCTLRSSPEAKDLSNYHLKTNRNYLPFRGAVLFNSRHDSLMTWLKLLAVSRENEDGKQARIRSYFFFPFLDSFTMFTCCNILRLDLVVLGWVYFYI